MNGKAAKRIRHAAACFGGDVKRLKREYKACPYHRRRKGNIVMESHSVILRRMHSMEAAKRIEETQ